MKKHNLILFFLLAMLQLAAKTPVEGFINNPLLENANISLLVKDIETNQILTQFNPKNSFTPASTMKIVTTATALELLGTDFSFETKIEIDGLISADGTFNGNLFIRGGGDPTLGSTKMGDIDFLNKWVAAVKKAGINRINGRIVADASYFDDEGVNPRWSWEDIGNYYASGAYGISYMDNTFKLVLRSGVIGTTPQILRIVPEISGLNFDNRLTSTAIKSDSAYFYGAPHSNSRYILGEIPANKDEFIIKGDIPNPGLLLAKHFHDRLIANGLIISQLPTDKYVPATLHTEIYVHNSPPLSDIITEINNHSNNHYAEHVFRYLSLKNNLIGTTSGAIQVIKSFWKSKGLPVDQLFMCDGSGLSPSNAVSAQFFVDLLTYMKTKSTNKNIFYNSLPISGESGTLSTLLINTNLQGKVHAKSGTISRVKSYAGYIYANYRTYVFAIIVNNPNGSSKTVVKKIEEFLLSVSAE
jgi:D-alanyl-D-alanine carboxypeptidase/D-alanyl-D-alanine-endopeptidase (penicillin-binding protein 4)